METKNWQMSKYQGGRKVILVIASLLLSIGKGFAETTDIRQNTISVTGKVTSASDRMPLIGLSIIVKRLAEDTISDIEENYKINVSSNATLFSPYMVFPELYVELYNADKSHNIEKVREFQLKVMRISTGIYIKGKYGSSYLIGLKCTLSVAGICRDFPAMPFTRYDKERRNEIEKEMGEIKKKAEWGQLITAVYTSTFMLYNTS